MNTFRVQEKTGNSGGMHIFRKEKKLVVVRRAWSVIPSTVIQKSMLSFQRKVGLLNMANGFFGICGNTIN